MRKLIIKGAIVATFAAVSVTPAMAWYKGGSSTSTTSSTSSTSSSSGGMTSTSTSSGGSTGSTSGNPAPVPEPATMGLLGAGVAGLIYGRRRRTKG